MYSAGQYLKKYFYYVYGLQYISVFGNMKWIALPTYYYNYLQNQDGAPKKTPFDDLGREDLIIKCKGLLAIAQKAKLAKAGKC